MLRQEQARQLHIPLDGGLGQPALTDKPPPIPPHQLFDRAASTSRHGHNTLLLKELQQGIQPVGTGDPPHSRRATRAAELRDHGPIQIPNDDSAGVHPPAHSPSHRLQLDHRARAIPAHSQPRPETLNERAHRPRLPRSSGHDLPPLPKHPAPTTEASIHRRNYADTSAPPDRINPPITGLSPPRPRTPRHSFVVGIGRPMPM